MSVVKINAIAVPDGQGELLEQRFAERAHLVEGMAGFEGFELLRPVRGDDRYFVVTHWRDHESFQAWVGSDSFRQGHAGSAGDRPRFGGRASLLEFDVVDLATVSQPTGHSQHRPEHATTAGIPAPDLGWVQPIDDRFDPPTAWMLRDLDSTGAPSSSRKWVHR